MGSYRVGSHQPMKNCECPGAGSRAFLLPVVLLNAFVHGCVCCGFASLCRVGGRILCTGMFHRCFCCSSHWSPQADSSSGSLQIPLRVGFWGPESFNIRNLGPLGCFLIRKDWALRFSSTGDSSRHYGLRLF